MSAVLGQLMTMVFYNTSKQQMQHQLQLVAHAGNDMELSQATTTKKTHTLSLHSFQPSG
jgi:hypothetical protein